VALGEAAVAVHHQVVQLKIMPLAQGSQFAGYTVVRLLGARGMGEV